MKKLIFKEAFSKFSRMKIFWKAISLFGFFLLVNGSLGSLAVAQTPTPRPLKTEEKGTFETIGKETDRTMKELDKGVEKVIKEIKGEPTPAPKKSSD